MKSKRLITENWYRFLNEDFSKEELRDMAMKDREGTLEIMKSLEILRQLSTDLNTLQTTLSEPGSQLSHEELSREIATVQGRIQEVEEIIRAEVHQIDQRK
tara:strand:- start:2625 stop:2927 length:303 start_codon:yes stop_codon:yes gene_type:complete